MEFIIYLYIMKYLLCIFFLCLLSCRKIVIGDYMYYYRIETDSPRSIVTYRKADGKVYNDTINHPNYYLYKKYWTYIWYSSSPDDKYYIKYKNESLEGYGKVMVIRNRDTLKVDATTTSLSFKK